MKNGYAKLLSPVLIGSHVLKNRLTREIKSKEMK